MDEILSWVEIKDSSYGVFFGTSSIVIPISESGDQTVVDDKTLGVLVGKYETLVSS